MGHVDDEVCASRKLFFCPRVVTGPPTRVRHSRNQPGHERKPHPAALLLCLDGLGISACDAVYVGDSPEDIAMARAARVYSIAVPGAYPNRGALLAERPDAVVPALRDILRHTSFI
jgi:phosphoglycolate phosphatase-like HAD superfamily hydrolase